MIAKRMRKPSRARADVTNGRFRGAFQRFWCTRTWHRGKDLNILRNELWRVAKTSLGEKAEPKWNFHKVLIGRDGDFLRAYPSAIRPTDTELVADIEGALNTGS